MESYFLVKLEEDRWDGSEEKGSIYGWGDFVYTKKVVISLINAKDIVEATKKARTVLKQKGIQFSFSKKHSNVQLLNTKEKNTFKYTNSNGIND